MATIAAIGSVSWALFQYVQTRPTLVGGQLAGDHRSGDHRSQAGRPLSVIEADDGRQLLWARGPRNVETGEWFDITDSPLDQNGYQYGIGKDSIPAIDDPVFVAIDQREELGKHNIHDQTLVIGYVNNGVAKAYPIFILDHHELVNDLVGGKPVTVGW